MESKKVISTKLKNEMSYYYGTENYYCDKAYYFKFTDGVKAFCEKAGAYWLLDLINSLFFERKYKAKMNADFISIDLKVDENDSAVISFKDSNGVFYEQGIPFTDCPMGNWKFYYDSGVLMWNGEY